MDRKTDRKSATAANGATAKPPSTEPVLLSGGNPQIAKGYGEAPVQAYIAAMPGWKSDVGTRSSSAQSLACARRSNGTRPSMVSRTMSGSSAFIASRNT
ncbi:hypothetical protein EV129_10281 [Rhizobium azibense]|uniref:Uncharacterized protein n=1 Tax=Rhizobium azibense TaxID=1136135 RepID=A0A4R3RXI3_9HYPH|nr:hypothetical protein EV129_10281 [Rhizobium azibense]